MNFQYPIFLDIAGKKCLVTGEGPEIAGKVRSLINLGGSVTYVNLRADVEIEELARAGLIRWQVRRFEPRDLADCFLVIGGRGSSPEMFRLAEEQNILCNAVDDPEHCRFIFGSIHRQGDLTIAASTNGVAPALAVRLREWLEHEIGPEYAALLAILKEFRPEMAARVPDSAMRRDLWYRIVDSDALAKIREGQSDAAVEIIRDLLEKAVSSTSRSDTSSGFGNR